jgi:hypothetical protein
MLISKCNKTSVIYQENFIKLYLVLEFELKARTKTHNYV